VHTAVKIAPQYDQPVAYVPDASRAAGVIRKLLNPDQKVQAAEDLLQEHERRRKAYQDRNSERKLLSIQDARANRTPFDWNNCTIDKPAFLGLRDYEVEVETLMEYIDWTPFFYTWEMKGRYPKILTDPKLGSEASKLFEDAQSLLRTLLKSGAFSQKP